MTAPMRTVSCVVVSLAVALSAASVQPRAAQAPAASCEPAGPIRFVCGQAGPEDLVAVPGTPFLIASAYGPDGGIHLVDTKAASSTRIFPSAAARERPDAKTYASCPGPLQGTDRERFRTHGLALKRGSGTLHTLYVVHHGTRESVEVFELDVRPNPPAITWIGCAVAPDPIGLNAVVPLPDGGFAATNFQPRAPAGGRGGGFPAEMLAGQRNGEVWEWHTAAGWTKVPGSESAAANGLEISADGRWYYVAQWGNRAFMRLSRGQTPVRRDEIPLGFRVDNVRWAPDGTLVVAGQGGPDSAIFGRGRGTPSPDAGVATSTIGKVDPQTLTYRELIDYPTSPAVSFATVAVQIGNEFWVGSAFGDRIARYPVSGLGATRAASLAPPVFHHLHLNSTDPAAAIAGYQKLWPDTTKKTTLAGFDGIENGRLYLLWNKVSSRPPVQPQSAYWHQVWLTPDVRRYVARARSHGMLPEPLYTSDEGGTVEISSETLPGTLTKAALAEARAKGVVPTRQAGYTYIAGPDGLSVEGFERAGETERLGQIDMWQDNPVCAELWYARHLGATRRTPAANAPQPTESTCVVAPGEPSWPSTMPQGTRRTPSGRAAYGDVALFWYTKPGGQPLASTRGQAVDHLAFAVRDLEAWVAKLKSEKVTILRGPYNFGRSKAVLIEGPSREAIELVEER